MHIVKLKGGLGNQLFQYAFARSLELTLNAPTLIDATTQYKDDPYQRHYTLDVFNTEVTQIPPKKIKRLLKKDPFIIHIIKQFLNVQKEQFTTINEETNPIKSLDDPQINNSNIIFDGYWQSESFFNTIRPTLLRDLTIKEPLSQENQSTLNKIKSQTSVSIHFRDYNVAENFHGNCSPKYYQNAIHHLKNTLSTPFQLIAFSDNHQRATDILKTLDTPYQLITNNDLQPEMDLELMKNCTHNIIANSSLSWWGAWLNPNTNKVVIAPKPWFKAENNDKIIPDNWRHFPSFEETK